MKTESRQLINEKKKVEDTTACTVKPNLNVKY